MANTKHKDKQRATITERRHQALEMRKNGASVRSIAKALGVSIGTVSNDIQAALDAAIAQNTNSAEGLRQMEIERLEMAMLAIHAQVRAGHLGAIDRWIKLSESRRRLMGLDEPIKIDNTGPAAILVTKMPIDEL